MSFSPGVIWRPKRSMTTPRVIVGYERSEHAQSHDRVRYRLMRKNESATVYTVLYRQWLNWIYFTDAAPDNAISAPPFPAAGPVDFYAVHCGEWFAVVDDAWCRTDAPL